MDAVKQLLSAAGGTALTLRPDWFVLTDGTAESFPRLVGDAALADSGKVKVFIDHETPCGSEKSGSRQRELINFAAERGCELYNGYGVSYQLMLEKHVRAGELVAHCGAFGSIYASAGAAAVSLTAEEMARALVTGEVTVTVPEAFALSVSGALGRGVSGKDAALDLLPRLAPAKGRLLVLDCSAAAWGAADRAAFCQLLGLCGCFAAAEGSVQGADLALDLGSVVPMAAGPNDFTKARPAAECSDVAVTSVFIGGCSQGRIEDIRAAVSVIRGRHVKRGVRALAAFASTEAYVAAANEGLIAQLLDAGVLVMNQGCSGCYAHSQGLADGRDTVLSAGSRSCPNCNGEGDVPTYLCSAATAMESAIAGYICPAEA